MKLPFSYKRDYFGVALLISMFGHLSYAAVSGDFLISDPAFSVAQAPSSMEVIILDDQQMKKDTAAAVVLTIEKGDANVPVVWQRNHETPPAQKIKNIIIPEMKGALKEADAKRHKNPAPEYPDYARRQGWEGLVMLKVDVDRYGRVKNVQIARSSAFKILDDAALKTIRKWAFDPASIGGVSFSSTVRIPVRFVLDDREKQTTVNY